MSALWVRPQRLGAAAAIAAGDGTKPSQHPRIERPPPQGYLSPSRRAASTCGTKMPSVCVVAAPDGPPRRKLERLGILMHLQDARDNKLIAENGCETPPPPGSHGRAPYRIAARPMPTTLTRRVCVCAVSKVSPPEVATDRGSFRLP